ncbi:hypothetical protein SAY87_026487 [Trapa incisa]|uniref:Uncharacterized protein n=1 Tax=Trapa incisa TaxID=236973 RepID=A0AAN7GRC5_9MYRT|nr:hypothetical protein SAY87_026487 [Trapa incisa]
MPSAALALSPSTSFIKVQNQSLIICLARLSLVQPPCPCMAPRIDARAISSRFLVLSSKKREDGLKVKVAASDLGSTVRMMARGNRTGQLGHFNLESCLVSGHEGISISSNSHNISICLRDCDHPAHGDIQSPLKTKDHPRSTCNNFTPCCSTHNGEPLDKFCHSYLQSAASEGLNVKQLFTRSLLFGICFHSY